MKMKRSQAFWNVGWVLSLPMPMTKSPSSRIFMARYVKSESLETMQKPLTTCLCMMSMASMTSPMSVAFLPDRLGMTIDGSSANSWSFFFQHAIWGLLQSP